MEDEARLYRMRDEWYELDEAMLVTFESLDPIGRWSWKSTNARVVAAWDDLTKPDHLDELEFRLAYFDSGAEMNDWAAAVTRKAIEVSRTRQSEQA
jgi:hypothetical protein